MSTVWSEDPVQVCLEHQNLLHSSVHVFISLFLELFDLNPKLQAACNCPQSCEDTMFQKQISFAQFPSEKFREAIAVLPLPSRNIR